MIVGANLLEASPAATASLLLKFHNKTKRPYYVDPMTYAFGAYVDPETEEVRHDLDWIKSDKKIRGQKDRFKRDFKSSYKSLADAFGPPFSTAVEFCAIKTSDFEMNSVRIRIQQRSQMTYLHQLCCLLPTSI